MAIVNTLKRLGQDDRKVAIPIRVAGAINVARAACPEGGEDPVRTEADAGLQGQQLRLNYMPAIGHVAPNFNPVG